MSKEIVKKMLIRTALAIVLIAGACGSCSYVNKQLGLSDDNVFEEKIEEVISDQFNIDIDLTSDSEEIDSK